ncbi:MAG: alanine dehydrogenase [Candidatus Omnitrophota bacterium]|nr:alanine dehydrogenase [Candidatus Omnitrophota bacterium]
MMVRKILILERSTIEEIVDVRRSITAVEEVFFEYGRNRIQMPPKIYLYLGKYRGDFRAMPAYVEKLDKCVLKWVNVHPDNKKFGLPAVMAIIILSDPKNGMPLCIMDGTYATAIRTGAAGAVAAKYLARANSKIIGLIGCGVQARAQLAAISKIFSFSMIKIWDTSSGYTKKFIDEINVPGAEIFKSKAIKECVSGCDIVVTTTPSRKPLIRLEWLKKGAHINAIGADAPGKEELEPRILKNAKIVVDSWEQARHSGEINVPLKKGMITKKDIYADIGEIACGRKSGRASENEITVFDSTGLAIQDVAIADLIYKTALKEKRGRWVNLL